MSILFTDNKKGMFKEQTQMRLSLRSAGLLSLFLLNLNNLSAEPLLRGFFIEKLPQNIASKPMLPGKGLVLAHVLNTDSKVIESGDYKIGVEIDSSGKKRSYALSPKESISAGALKTFRMAIPISEAEKNSAYFRIFSRIDGKMVWSDRYSFLQGAYSDKNNKIKTLYTEALPEPNISNPPKEVPFENEKTARKVAELENITKSAKTTKKKTISKKSNSLRVVKVEHTVPARNIDMSEFKTLRTIDEELVIYVIKLGDTLGSIAEKYYGKSSKERAIADLNFIEKLSSIKVGEEIIVDVKPLGKSETAVRIGRISDQSFEGKRTYKVKKGDTLGKIAKIYLGSSSGSSVKKILNANPGISPSRLAIGDTLIIPDKGDNV